MDATPTPIDPRGPRTNQAVLAVGLVVGLLLGQWLVVPIFALFLFLGAAFGPSWGPVLRFYAAVIRPRLAPPRELEDPRPPRFAATVGVIFLGAATLAFVLGAPTVGWVLAMIVAVLAAAAATTGLCVGCEMYVLLIRLRGGVRIVTIERESSDLIDVDRPERSKGLPSVPSVHLDGRPVWLVFTTEYCAVCPKIVAEIRSRRSDDSVVVLDVADHLDLASAYKVRRAPTVIRAEADGSVIVRLAGADAVRAELDALAVETVTAA